MASFLIAGVPKGSILEPLFFLIYINDLSDNLSSNPKLFVDDTSLFLAVYDINQSGINLNDNLEKISSWAFQWKMSLNPDINKQAQEVIFSRKLQKSNYPSQTFHGTNVTQSEIQKHLGMFLDSKLDFKEHMQNVLNKVSKTIGLLHKLQKFLPRPPLITIYKSFISPHLDYGDIIYDQAYNVSFHQKLESIPYNSALAIAGAIRGTSREKLYHELSLESLVSRRWYHQLCCFYEVFKTLSPRYLFDVYSTRNNDKLPHFKVKHNYFKNSFFPSTVIEWNKLDLNIRNSESAISFKSKVLKFIRPSENSLFLCNNAKGIQLLTRLRPGLSHLRDHKFKHNFQNTLNPICNCGEDIETSCQYLLRCSHYTNERLALLNVIQGIDNSILELADSHIFEVLLYGRKFLDISSNTNILNATTKRFDERLFQSKNQLNHGFLHFHFSNLTSFFRH